MVRLKAGNDGSDLRPENDGSSSMKVMIPSFGWKGARSYAGL